MGDDTDTKREAFPPGCDLLAVKGSRRAMIDRGSVHGYQSRGWTVSDEHGTPIPPVEPPEPDHPEPDPASVGAGPIEDRDDGHDDEPGLGRFPLDDDDDDA